MAVEIEDTLIRRLHHLIDTHTEDEFSGAMEMCDDADGLYLALQTLYEYKKISRSQPPIADDPPPTLQSVISDLANVIQHLPLPVEVVQKEFERQFPHRDLVLSSTGMDLEQTLSWVRSRVPVKEQPKRALHFWIDNILRLSYLAGEPHLVRAIELLVDTAKITLINNIRRFPTRQKLSNIRLLWAKAPIHWYKNELSRLLIVDALFKDLFEIVAMPQPIVITLIEYGVFNEDGTLIDDLRTPL
jgi:hypothetical protein